MNITSEELLKESRALEPQLQQWRRTLHRHPEVGFDLPHTKELVKKATLPLGEEYQKLLDRKILKKGIITF